MKIYISADLEGVGGVARHEHSRVDGREYPLARRLMTTEVNAAIGGAFEAGAIAYLFNIDDSQIDHMVYGHLHGPESFKNLYQGKKDQTLYHLVSADYLEFTLKKISD